MPKPKLSPDAIIDLIAVRHRRKANKFLEKVRGKPMTDAMAEVIQSVTTTRDTEIRCYLDAIDILTPDEEDE